MLADNKPMKFYERTISPTLLFRIKDESKTFTSVFDSKEQGGENSSFIEFHRFIVG